MTPLRLRDGLSYCKVEGHLIFLDIHNDRYFRLAEETEHAFARHLNGDGSDIDIQRLIERDILIDGTDGAGHASRSATDVPTHSAMEEVLPGHRRNAGAALDTLSAVCSTHLQLRTRRLKHVLDRLASYRMARTCKASACGGGERRVLEASASFRSARPFVPIDTCCLLDSVAMIKFLAKRGLHADLVFGVTADPFSAHCWVQHGTTVLNDTLGHVSAHTPIRVF